jgi:prepilin-type N-terminal cleavage/methylation domain-containing protein/prepilin-type processing-associated H-X9-DG protein
MGSPRVGHGGRHSAFTLVELLVVIGIIALLISILLPALSSVRKQAEGLKCATALREIGNAVLMYASENKGYAPPAQCRGAYNLYGVTYGAAASSTVNGKVVATSTNAYWINFLQKYVAGTKNIGTASATNAEAIDAANSVLWGCGAFQRYASTALGGFNRVQNGYGWNYMPTYTPTDPPLGTSYPARALDTVAYPGVPNTRGLNSFIGGASSWANGITHGTWFKLNRYTQASERALSGDAQFWLVEALAPPLTGVIPQQKLYNNTATYSSGVSGQTLWDFYRHGKYPKIEVGGDTGYYSRDGGKVSFNILYADGHVSTSNDRSDGYKSIRRRFPG